MKSTEQKINELEKQLQELKAEVAKQNQPKFKKGDFLVEQDGWIYIFDSIRRNVKTSHNHIVAMCLEDDDLTISDGSYFLSNCIDVRLATESEEKLLIDALHNLGKDWDYVNKQIVDYRWRAKNRENYYYISSECKIEKDVESKFGGDKLKFQFGNYFKTKELAEVAAEKVKELLLTLKHS